jgi:hypothetical protein
MREILTSIRSYITTTLHPNPFKNIKLIVFYLFYFF